jgi:hypothetical protein
MTNAQRLPSSGAASTSSARSNFGSHAMRSRNSPCFRGRHDKRSGVVRQRPSSSCRAEHPTSVAHGLVEVGKERKGRT